MAMQNADPVLDGAGGVAMASPIDDTIAKTAPEQDDDLDAIISEELPGFDSPPLRRFFVGMDSFIQTEERKRSDWVFREGQTKIGKLAGKIVDRIRYDEVENHQGGGPPRGTGLPFEKVKGDIKESRLWKIVKRMPKGALLHAHLDGFVDIRKVVEWILDTSELCMKAEGPLSDAKRLRSGKFGFCVTGVKEKTVPLWHDQYSPHSVVSVREAAQSFPDGVKAFEAWLISRTTLTPQDTTDTEGGTSAIWVKFADCFAIVQSAIFYEPIWRRYCLQAFRQLAADNIKWAEFRLSFHFLFTKTGETKPMIPVDGFEAAVRIFGEELEKFKSSDEGLGFWGSRMIWTAIRLAPTKQLVQCMIDSIDVKRECPALIAGYDLVGYEAMGRPLSDMCPELFWFRKQCAAEEIEMPFFFHAGECLSSGDDTERNMLTAVLLGTRRMGHGTALYKHPQLMRSVNDKKILVECCPISNEILRLVGGTHSHPLPALLANGVAVSLSSDDPSTFGHHSIEPDSLANFGVSTDFWQCLRAFQDLGLAGLGSLAENSVRWAAYEDQNTKEWLEGISSGTMGTEIKASHMKEWATSWEEFCIWIVEEFGEEYAPD